jgi:putative peptidoglycan lipid II flippase
LILVLRSMRKIEPPRFTYTSTQWPIFWRGFVVMLLGQLLLSFNMVLDQFFAARLPEGAIASLSYANRILALILSLGALAISRAMLPIFSNEESSSRGNLGGIVRRWATIMFVVGAAIAAVTWCLTPLVVALFFERGAFSAQNTEEVSAVVRFGLLQVPFYFAALVLTSYASSRRHYATLFWSGFIALACKLASNSVLTPWLGVSGLALGWSFVYAANAAFFWLVLRAR